MIKRDPKAVEMIERLFPDAGVKGMEFLETLDPTYRQWWERTVLAVCTLARFWTRRLGNSVHYPHW